MEIYEPVNLIGMDMKGMEELSASMGQPSYRGRQLYQWIYARHIDDLDRMSDLPVKFRKQLLEVCKLGLPGVEKKQIAEDGTSKFLLRMQDGTGIETVAIPHIRGERSGFTLCVSTQAGCPLACAFCATGASGFKRNLTAAEIIGQVLRAMQDMASESDKDSDKLISNIVFMGMGEPLLNYGQCLKSIRLINDDAGINIGQRHITISTAGVVPGIERLAREGLQVTLAVSLHAADDRTRDQLVPLNRKYPLAILLKAVDAYIESTGRRVSFEYVLLKGINSSVEDAGRLAGIVKGRRANVNLIPFNATPGSRYRPPGRDDIRRFVKRLEDAGVTVTLRKEHGAGIDAACGQLVLHSND